MSIDQVGSTFGYCEAADVDAYAYARMRDGAA